MCQDLPADGRGRAPWDPCPGPGHRRMGWITKGLAPDWLLNASHVVPFLNEEIPCCPHLQGGINSLTCKHAKLQILGGIRGNLTPVPRNGCGASHLATKGPNAIDVPVPCGVPGFPLLVGNEPDTRRAVHRRKLTLANTASGSGERGDGVDEALEGQSERYEANRFRERVCRV